MNTKIIAFQGAKGGVGTSTAATKTALYWSSHALSVLFYHHDDAVSAMLGLPSGTRLAPGNITLTDDFDEAELAVQANQYDLVVFDLDREMPPPCPKHDNVERIICVTNDYVALRLYLDRGPATYTKALCLYDHNRVLRKEDIEATVSLPVKFVEFNYAVARTLDAGLLAGRPVLSVL